MATGFTIFRLVINQSSSWSLLGRVTAQTASGAESPEPAEGFLLLPVDLLSIVINVYDPTAPNPSSPIYTANPSPSSVLSALQTGNVWTAIVGGGNFEFSFPNTVFILPDHPYIIVITWTLIGGAISQSQCDIRTRKVGV